MKGMEDEAHRLYGAPSDAWLQLTFPAAPAPGPASGSIEGAQILCNLQLVNKTATRIPEALFFTFPLRASSSFSTRTAAGAGAGAGWQLDKLGQWVDARDVVAGGGVHLHAVGDAGVKLAVPSPAPSPAPTHAHAHASAAPGFVQAQPVDSGYVYCMH
jgi:hypothetical protein